MTPEPHGDGQAYVARGEFMPLALLSDKAETPPVREGVVHVRLRGEDLNLRPSGYEEAATSLLGLLFL
jgi:hypothetical protein